MNAKFFARFGRALTLLILTLALSVCAVIALLYNGGSKTYAADAADSSVVLPSSSLEYQSLSNPKGACCFGECYAVIEGKTVRVFKSGLSKTLSGFTSLGQIKLYDENTLFVSDNGLILRINLSTDEKKQVTGGTFFDFNDKYLVTFYSRSLFVYKMSDAIASADGDSLKEEKELDDVSGKCSVAVNETNDVFYLSGETNIKLVKYNIDTKKSEELLQNLTANTPSIMIANDSDIYLVRGEKIYSLPIEADADFTELTAYDTLYELGTVRSPVGLSFKNGNLLVTDNSLNAITEFAIDGDKLDFTGFAIASGRSAYNRIGKATNTLGRYGNFVAALDDFKLTIINVGENAENFDRYDKDNFINLFVGSVPKAFALGNGTLLTTDGAKVNGYKKIFTSAASEIQAQNAPTVVGISGTIKAISYQSGYYYVLATDETNAYVYKIDEKTFETVGEAITFNGKPAADKITADAYGNVYIADGSSIYKNSVANSFSSRGAISLTTDLAGVLYGVIDGKVYYYKPAGGWILAAELDTGSVKNIGCYFDKNEIYYTLIGEERLLKTTGLKNLAVNSVDLGKDLLNRAALPYEEAVDNGQDDLRYYVVNVSESVTYGNNVNVYSVDYSEEDGKLGFSELLQVEDEYIWLMDVKLPTALGTELSLCVFASNKGISLVNAKDVKKTEKQKLTAPEKAYTSTKVNLYHLPAITEKDLFSATSGGDAIRLERATEIYPRSKLVFSNIEYYFATVTVGGKEYAGYIPSSFTVETLYENPDKDEYTVKTVSAVTVYANADLTDDVCELADGTKVRYYGTENGAAKIAYETADGYKIGYIEERKIRKDASVALRNILITLAVITSACGTATFFILRKKKK